MSYSSLNGITAYYQPTTVGPFGPQEASQAMISSKHLKTTNKSLRSCAALHKSVARDFQDGSLEPLSDQLMCLFDMQRNCT